MIIPAKRSPASAKHTFVLLMALTCVMTAACGSRHGTVESLPAGGVSDARLSPSAVDGERAMKWVEELVEISPRDSGTPNAEKAGQYLAAELKKLGIVPHIDEFIDQTPGGSNVFRNVTGIAAGTSGGMIVIGSHYDTKSGIKGFQGANDSGSSCGLLLELAAVIGNSHGTGPDIMFAFLDGEECVRKYGRYDGLHGSRRLARQLVDEGRKNDVIAVIIIDMIGDRDLNVSLPANNTPALSSTIFRAADAEGVRGTFALDKRFVLDDHVPFLQAGMPAADIIDFSYGSQPGKNDYWHTDQDAIDKLSAASLQTVGRVVIRTINLLSE